MSPLTPRRHPRPLVSWLFAAPLTSSGCDLPFTRRLYVPGRAGLLPYQDVRGTAKQCFQKGLAAERTGDLRQAPENDRQARQWDRAGPGMFSPL